MPYHQSTTSTLYHPTTAETMDLFHNFLASGKRPDRQSTSNITAETIPELIREHISKPTFEPTAERSQVFKFFERYFTMDLLDDHKLVSLEALDVTRRVEVGKIQTRGGFADVYDGLMRQEGSDQNNRVTKVAVKVFRTFVQHTDAHEVWHAGWHVLSMHRLHHLQKFQLHPVARELRLWTNIEHDNVLQCLGFMEYNGFPALVSEWMENGNLIQFLSNNANANQLKMVCMIALSIKTALMSF